jgi:hypothetical protein
MSFFVLHCRDSSKGARRPMPNGGPDNCSTCGFNLRNRGIWRNPHPDDSQLPFCEIRGLKVLFEHWTYCVNWHTRSRTPVGPVYSSGMYDDGYHRIPWHGSIEPEKVYSGVCHECRGAVSEGIFIAAVERADLTFCSNEHYLQWWKRQHPEEDAPMSAEIGQE